MNAALELEVCLSEDWHDDAEEFKAFLKKEFGDKALVVNQKVHPVMCSDIFIVLTRESCLERFFELFTPGGETLEEWLSYSQVQLNLHPMTMTWRDADGEYCLSMNVWLHETSSIAFADKEGRIQIRDLDIEVPNEICKEEFTKRNI